jgi:hypothetical protein
MAANDDNDKRRAVIRQAVETRLRILKIERAALAKLGGTGREHKTCSFCGKREEQVSVLVPGLDNAFVCDECVGSLAGLLKDAEKN